MKQQVQCIGELISSQIQQIHSYFMNIQNLQSKTQNSNSTIHNQEYIHQSHIRDEKEPIQPLLKIILNSLKINEKIHNSILQKQQQIQQQTKQIITQSLQTEHKLTDTLKSTKQLYQQTIHQNKKSKFLLEQLITPLRQQLKSKVDQTLFSLQMKLLLEEYDSMGHKITYDMMNQDEKLKHENRQTIQSQTLIFLKDKILPILSQLQQKFDTYQQTNQSLIQRKFYQFTNKVLQIQSELKLHLQAILQNHYIKNTQQLINEKVDEKSVQKIINRMFPLLIMQNNRTLTSQMTKTHQFAKHLEVNFTHEVQHIKKCIATAIKSQQNTQRSLLTQIQRHKQQLNSQQIMIEKHQLQIQQLHQQLKKHDQNLQFVEKFYQKFENLENKIQKDQSSSFQIEFKSQQIQTLIQKLNEFKAQSKKIKKFEKQAEEKSHFLKGQLQGIRDILSKKANFSDILIHMQNKVDKQQFKEFKMLFQEIKEIKQDPSFFKNLQPAREIVHSSLSKKQHLRNRSFFGSSIVSKPTTSSELQIQQVKRFKLGFTPEFITPADSIKTHSKTQQLRQSIRDNNNSNIFTHQVTHI